MATYKKKQVRGGSGIITNADYKTPPKPKIKKTIPRDFDNKRDLPVGEKTNQFITLVKRLNKTKRVVGWENNQGKTFKEFKLHNKNDVVLILSDLNSLGVGQSFMPTFKKILEEYLLTYINFLKSGYNNNFNYWFSELNDHEYQNCTGYDDKEKNQGVGVDRFYCVSTQSEKPIGNIKITLYTGN